MHQEGSVNQRGRGRKLLLFLLLFFLFLLLLLSSTNLSANSLRFLHLPPHASKAGGGGRGGEGREEGTEGEAEEITIASNINKLPQEKNTDVTPEIPLKQPLLSPITGKEEEEGEGGNAGEVEELREVLEELLHLLSIPTYTCRKLIDMGGYSCNHKKDGHKYVCQDPGTSPPGEYCLVYSLGAGHDFSFDSSMSSFGCEVFVFDDDESHRKYPTQMGRGIWFYKTRIGTSFYKLLRTSYSPSSPTSAPQLLTYWPLPAIMRRLGHHHNHLHYLKMDIEGSEWKVLEESLFGTSILAHTQQLGLEVHLDELKTDNKTHDHLLLIARKYLRVMQGLKERGFRLAHWEPNFRGPELVTIAGLTFHLFSETLWVNTKFKPKRNLPTKQNPPLSL